MILVDSYVEFLEPRSAKARWRNLLRDLRKMLLRRLSHLASQLRVAMVDVKVLGLVNLEALARVFSARRCFSTSTGTSGLRSPGSPFLSLLT